MNRHVVGCVNQDSPLSLIVRQPVWVMRVHKIIIMPVKLLWGFDLWSFVYDQSNIWVVISESNELCSLSLHLVRTTNSNTSLLILSRHYSRVTVDKGATRPRQPLAEASTLSSVHRARAMPATVSIGDLGRLPHWERHIDYSRLLPWTWVSTLVAICRERVNLIQCPRSPRASDEKIDLSARTDSALPNFIVDCSMWLLQNIQWILYCRQIATPTILVLFSFSFFTGWTQYKFN